MTRIVLDYSEYIEDRYEYAQKGPYGAIQKTDHRRPNDAQKFFSKKGHCPFCNIAANLVYDHYDERPRFIDMFLFMKVWECEGCGWWEFSSEFSEEKDLIYEMDSLHWAERKYAIVRRYDISKHQTPVRTLIAELRKNKQLLYEMEPHRLEYVAQYVFSSFYNCEVRHVGKSHDGGVDLIVVQSEEPILVQVKRRASPKAAESVSTVREFIGAMYLKNARHGIIVSTARRFSREAQSSARKIVEDRKFILFDLIDYGRFCSMLDVIKKDDDKPWKKFVEQYKFKRYG